MKNQQRSIFGVILILIGLVFLLNRLDFIPDSWWFLFRWYMILVVIGVYNLLTGKKQGGIILLVIGGVFLLEDLGFYDLNWGLLWPVLLIALGVLFIFRRTISSAGKEELSDISFDTASILGGGQIVVTSKSLKGGKVTSFLGGSQIDMTRCEIDGEAVLDVFTLMGGAEIRVPDHWNVNIETTAILGGFGDSRTIKPDGTGPTLRIKGTTIMGGGEIKN